jgi:hypothetical protein
MTDDDIRNACHEYGARRVYEAAYARMVGYDRTRLREVGLPGVFDFVDARFIARIALGVLRVENQATEHPTRPA